MHFILFTLNVKYGHLNSSFKSFWIILSCKKISNTLNIWRFLKILKNLKSFEYLWIASKNLKCLESFLKSFKVNEIFKNIIITYVYV